MSDNTQQHRFRLRIRLSLQAFQLHTYSDKLNLSNDNSTIKQSQTVTTTDTHFSDKRQIETVTESDLYVTSASLSDKDVQYEFTNEPNMDTCLNCFHRSVK